ncbi:hypothetical protein PVK06_015349 [Gossypium arboreum]|uniref:Uncharacterized protein n=1 Tax=Gossypium arboreum TaxID=29729 RepID=A0ABR0PX23_GOSAR|nr:hypothetical protein PVK06_015349 [Gossypium arboreum]
MLLNQSSQLFAKGASIRAAPRLSIYRSTASLFICIFEEVNFPWLHWREVRHFSESEDGRLRMRYQFDSHDAVGSCSAVIGSARNATVAASTRLHFPHLRFRVGLRFHLPLSCLQMMIHGDFIAF